MSARKLVLCVVDSLRTDILERAATDGDAPTFAALLDRGTLIRDCVSSFPSVTPVCTSEITTGVAPDRHWISGMNWYHRAERRYVEYGSSFEATRAFGLFRSLYDTVYNMNMAHLSDEVETVYETLGDHGVRTACTPFLIYRGRTRHEMGLEGLLRRVALAATFRHATWDPTSFSTASSTRAARGRVSRRWPARGRATQTRPAVGASWSSTTSTTSFSTRCPTTTTTPTSTGRRRSSSPSPSPTPPSRSSSTRAAGWTPSSTPTP